MLCQSTILNERIYQASKKFNQRTEDAYLGAGVRFAEGFCAKVLGHDCPLRQRSDGAHTIVDFDLLQLVGGEPGRVSAIGVVPHAVCPSGERLNSTLEESADQLEARHLFFGCGLQLLNLLHQGLHNGHLLVDQFVRPRCSGPRDIGRAKFFKPKFLTDGGLVPGVEPSCSPAGIVLRHSQLDVLDVETHCAAETAGLIMERAPDDEDLPPERPVGFDPHEAFTQRDKARYV
jgi:hypothetical protein